MPAAPRILISAGEASGDRYAACLATHLRRHFADAEFFGCAGAEMRAAGVRAVVQAESLAVVGIAEVLTHLPRIYGEYRGLLAAAREGRPLFAVLTDSPDFHLRVARRLHALKIPVFYLVAPQVWAWREGRVAQIRRNVNELHCIFPFEEEFFRARGVAAHYIGNPPARLVRASAEPAELKQAFGFDPERPLVTLCPGSRRGELDRHWPILRDAVLMLARNSNLQFALALPRGSAAPAENLAPVRLVEGRTWDALAAADVALVASGTVATEAAMLGTPMITFYKVAPATWVVGRPFVRVPFYTMVNLIAGRRVVPELIQHDMRPQRIAAAAERLLADAAEREAQRRGLAEVAARLRTAHDPLERSAALIAAAMERMM